jgi:hypothetical protein
MFKIYEKNNNSVHSTNLRPILKGSYANKMLKNI